MVLRLRPGLHRAWRRPGRLQIGLDRRHGVLLDGVQPAEERLLAALAEGLTRERLLARARRLGVDPERLRALLAELDAAGALAAAPTRPSRLARLPDALRHRLGGDATVLGLAHPDGDGWHVLAERRTRCVAVVGAGRTGLAVALGLAAGAVGTVLVEDDAPVGADDVAPGGYPVQALGRPRAPAAAELVAAHGPGTRTSAPGPVRPDLVVLVGHGVLDPALGDGLLREDVAHLPVVWGEAAVSVGPLVVPGASGCLRCQHLHRTDRDPEWPRVAAQLACRPGSPVGGGAAGALGAEEGSLAALAAAHATSAALAHLDGAALPPGTALELALPGGAVASRAWPPHPRCGCWGLPEGAEPPPAVTMVR